MGEVGPVWGGGMVDFGRGGPAYGTFPGEGRVDCRVWRQRRSNVWVQGWSVAVRGERSSWQMGQVVGGERERGCGCVSVGESNCGGEGLG